METFYYQRQQSGFWGSCLMDKIIKVKAKSQLYADLMVSGRKDYHKRLRNGDLMTWVKMGD